MGSLFLSRGLIHADLLATPMPAAHQMLMEELPRRVPFKPILEVQIECEFHRID
jgi:hypothetical protein